MAPISLRISFGETGAMKTMQFEAGESVYDACRMIRERIGDESKMSDFGLFFPNESSTKGRWLEMGKTFDYYDVKTGDLMQYRKKHRPLRVKMMDGSTKMVIIDESQKVGSVVEEVCRKIGLANPEEYSLVHDQKPDEGEADKAGPKSQAGVTKKRLNYEAKVNRKMEKLRAQLKTDEDTKWLQHDRTLGEQGLEDQSMVILRKKFFYSDQNVDRNDPIQLNLLYVQSRDAILNGSHPCSEDDTVRFSAMQCQVQLGDYTDEKAKSLRVRDYLPHEYVKIRGINKSVATEYAKLKGMNEVNAKYRYIQLSRRLPTYGITFFLVREEVPGRSKLEPVLLGISRDTVMRLSKQTKEVLEKWPMGQIRRWAASPKTFTIDFGDHRPPVPFQTTEGDAISNLIGGYIDIILKKRANPDKLDIDDVELTGAMEEHIQPARGTALQYLPSNQQFAHEGSVAMPGRIGAAAVSYAGVSGMPQVAQYGQLQQAQMQHFQAAKPMSVAEQLLSSQLNDARTAVEQAGIDLNAATELPPMGDDPASVAWKNRTQNGARQNVMTHLNNICTAAANLCEMTAGLDGKEGLDNALAAKEIAAIIAGLNAGVKDIRMLAALSGDDEASAKLLAAAREMANATGHMMNFIDDNETMGRMEMLASAVGLGKATQVLFSRMGGRQHMTPDNVKGMHDLSKALVARGQAMLTALKQSASACDDPLEQSRLIDCAKDLSQRCSDLAAISKLLTPVLHSEVAQQKLMAAIRAVEQSLEEALQLCDTNMLSGDDSGGLLSAAKDLKNALENLGQAAEDGGQVTATPESEVERACNDIVTGCDRLIDSLGNTRGMVEAAKVMGSAAGVLVANLKTRTENLADGDDEKSRLLGAAKSIADATSGLIAAIREAHVDPNDPDAQADLKSAAYKVKDAAFAAAEDVMRKRVMRNLAECARQLHGRNTDLGTTANTMLNKIRYPHLMQQMTAVLKENGTTCAQLIDAIDGFENDMDDAGGHLNLVSACLEAIVPTLRAVQTSKSCGPAIEDRASAVTLNQAAFESAKAANALNEMAKGAQEMCVPLEMAVAVQQLQKLKANANANLEAIDNGKLLVLPGEDSDAAVSNLTSTARMLRSAMAQLCAAAESGDNRLGSQLARDVAGASKQLSLDIRAIAAAEDSDDELGMENKRRIMESLLAILDQSSAVVVGAQKALQKHQEQGEGAVQPKEIENLKSAAAALSALFKGMIPHLPGVRDVDEAVAAINELISGEADTTNVVGMNGELSYDDLTARVNKLAATFRNATTELQTAAHEGHDAVARSANQVYHSFEELYLATCGLAHICSDPKARDDIIDYVASLAVTTVKLLNTAKVGVTDPTSPQLTNALAVAAREMSESINGLLASLIARDIPGLRECDEAQNIVLTGANRLHQAQYPQLNAAYFDCVANIRDKSKDAQQMLNEITNKVRNSEREEVGPRLLEAARELSDILTASAHSAYLVAIADPSSTAAVPGLIAMERVTNVTSKLQDQCTMLRQQTRTTDEFLQAATSMTVDGGTLIQMIRAAADSIEEKDNSYSADSLRDRAQELASGLSRIVSSIKTIGSGDNAEVRDQISEAADAFSAQVENVSQALSGPEFSGTAAVIGFEGRAAMEPIIDTAGRLTDQFDGLTDELRGWLRGADNSAVESGSSAPVHAMNLYSKGINDVVRNVLQCIQDAAPGQKQCAEAMDEITMAMTELDRALLAVTMGELEPREDQDIDGYMSQLLESISNVQQDIMDVTVAAKGEPNRLGHAVVSLQANVRAVADMSVGYSSLLPSTDKVLQAKSITHAKTSLEAGMQLIYATKESGGNRAARKAHTQVEAAGKDLSRSLATLETQLQSAGDNAKVFGEIITTINRAGATLTDTPEGNDHGFGANYSLVDALFKAAKTVGQGTSGVLMAPPEQLPRACREAAQGYVKFASVAQHAYAAKDKLAGELREAILADTKALGMKYVGMTEAASKLFASPTSSPVRRGFSDRSNEVMTAIQNVLVTLQKAQKGSLACDTSIGRLNNLMNELATATLFMAAGSFADEEGEVMPTADAAVKLRNALNDVAVAASGANKVVSADSSTVQDELEKIANDSSSVCVSLVAATKTAVRSLTDDGDQSTKELLLNSAKDICGAMSAVMAQAKSVTAKGTSATANDESSLAEAAAKLSSLVKNLNDLSGSLDDENMRASLALQGTLDALELGMSDLEKAATSSGPQSSLQQLPQQAEPEELLRFSFTASREAAKLSAAVEEGRVKDVAERSNTVRKNALNMLDTCRSVMLSCETDDSSRNLQRVVLEGGICLRDLLEALNSDLTESVKDGDHSTVMRLVANSFGRINDMCRRLAGQDFEDDADDPAKIAEQSLTDAVAAIEAAAGDMKALKESREAEMQNVKAEDLGYDVKMESMLLGATQAIAQACAGLVTCAIAANKELIKDGKITVDKSSTRYNEDLMWSEGLVSAAKAVVSGTKDLCTVGNDIVAAEGDIPEDRLIACARNVAACTAQLLVAQQVKADPNAKTSQNLHSAGKKVKGATDRLVEAVRQRETKDSGKFDTDTPMSMVQFMRKEQDLQTEVLRLERELQDARLRLGRLREQRYRVLGRKGL
eukprot:Clim_evm100s108 gene=Clim_evmTU100s108